MLYNLPSELPYFHVLTVIYAELFPIYITQKIKNLLYEYRFGEVLTWQAVSCCEKDLGALTEFTLNVSQELALIL